MPTFSNATTGASAPERRLSVFTRSFKLGPSRSSSLAIRRAAIRPRGE